MDVILDALSQSFEQLLGRASGPLNFRLVVMPIVVTFLAIRAYRKDVREGNPLFLGAFITSPTERKRLFRSGLKDFGRVFIIACVLDTTYQILVFRSFFPLQMLIVAVVCAIVPYFLIRGPVTRIAHSLFAKKAGPASEPAAESTPADEGSEKMDSIDE